MRVTWAPLITLRAWNGPWGGFSKNSTTFQGSQHSGRRLVGSRQGADRLPKAEKERRATAQPHAHEGELRQQHSAHYIVRTRITHLRTLSLTESSSCQELHGQTWGKHFLWVYISVRPIVAQNRQIGSFRHLLAAKKKNLCRFFS